MKEAVAGISASVCLAGCGLLPLYRGGGLSGRPSDQENPVFRDLGKYSIWSGTEHIFLEGPEAEIPRTGSGRRMLTTGSGEQTGEKSERICWSDRSLALCRRYLFVTAD